MGNVISGFLLETRSWHRERGQERPVRKGTRPLRLILFVIIPLIIFYLFFVWSRLWVINLGYRVSQALKEQKELLEVNENLKIERATWISPDRIGDEARKKLGMNKPQENQVRYVK